MLLTFLIICIQGVYTLINLMLQYGVGRKTETVQHQPFVSILIAARNEEEQLPFCLETISALQYPRELLEVLILNDHSSDSTPEIAQKYADRYPYIRLIHIENTLPGLQGKTNSLAQGIKISTGEIIMITDADCRVPPGWVTEFVKYFTNDVGLVGSMTLLRSVKNKKSIFTHLQTVDWIFLQGVAAGISGLNLPVTVLGNNFGFRRQAYNSTGGFEVLGFTLAEDMRLLQAIQHRGWKILYPLQAATAVHSEPAATLKEFYRQRLRWVKSGSTSSWAGYILMVTSFLAHLSVLAAVVFNLFHSAVLMAIGSVLLTDFIFLWKLLKRFGLGKMTFYFPVFEIFYLLYTLFFAVLFFLPLKVIWKERSYK